MLEKEPVTLERVYQILLDLKQDIEFLKKAFLENPDLREDFVAQMKDIELEKAIPVEDFAKRYELKYFLINM